MLRERGAFQTWVDRYNPSYRVGRVVEAWIEGLDQASWQYPSAPWAEDPNYRVATVPDSDGTTVFYLVGVGDPDQVDLVWIGPESDAGHLDPVSS